LEGAFSAIHLCQNLEKKGMKSSETTPLSVVLIVACKKKIHVLFLNSIHPTPFRTLAGYLCDDLLRKPMPAVKQSLNITAALLRRRAKMNGSTTAFFLTKSPYQL
jgi:hypothetical protein